MESAITTGTWSGVEGAYYVGLGGAELPWVLLSALLCGLAVWRGAQHEKQAYDAVRSTKG